MSYPGLGEEEYESTYGRTPDEVEKAVTQNVSSRLPGDDREGGGDVGHRPSPAAPTPKPHSELDDLVAKARLYANRKDHTSGEAYVAIIAAINALEEQFEALRRPLEEASAAGCHFVKQGDGPECRVEWPGREDRENWCRSCFSHAVLTSNPAKRQEGDGA